ncbi:MAG: undecaprenyl-diphosphate phosphatase [Syntrophomonadaceae bacterium]|nr:undecaprenyl-diphosphate phosphatase [Syntrophomonadaceae bacterium]
MSALAAVLLGMLQGLTEFLPVSSSGHLVIAEQLLGVPASGLTFEVMVHIGTLAAVLVAFWPDVAALLRRPWQRLTGLLVLGTVPAALAGVFLEPLVERAFQSLATVGLGLLATGVLLVLGETASRRAWWGKKADGITALDAVLVGVMQAIAILPGISRSGSTIAGGLLRGLDREYAARFSFLLSIPAILGAAALEGWDVVRAGVGGALAVPYLLGSVTAALFGYLAITLVMAVVREGRLTWFAYYCWGLGALVLGSQLLR